MARFAVPPALLGIRGLARLTRQLAADWCGVPIPERYAPRPDEALTFTGRLRWLATDPATWRDVAWTAANLVAVVLAALSAVIIATGLIEFIGPELTREIPPPAFPGNTAGTLAVLGLAIASVGVLAAPALLRAYGLLARSILAPDGEAELASRVRQLTQSRTEALDTGAAEIRRIERDLHDGAQARLVAMGMTLDAAGQVIDTNPEAARALVFEARDASVKALAELRALIRGIHPPVLADRGLADAIRALALDTPARIHLASDLNGRPPAPVESAAYFAVSELLANVSKHAEARQTWFDIRYTDETADQPDVAIVDVRLPPTFTDEGIRAALAARREVPGLPVLVLSQYVEQLYARELLAGGSGGIGYLLKDRVFDSGQFVDAVRRAAPRWIRR